MEINRSSLEAFVRNPSESLSREIKSWIDPDSPEGKAMIIRTSLALRNHGGGLILIGFDNATLRPLPYDSETEVKALFHVDKIQGLVAKFSSEVFEVAVEYVSCDNQVHPIIMISSGVKTPVAAKRGLESSDSKKPLICEGDIYVRSLNTNNTPSTTKPNWRDWPRIVEICFNNREADVAGFLRRNFAALNPEKIRDIVGSLSHEIMPAKTSEQVLTEMLEEGYSRFLFVKEKRKITLPDQGSWEVALIIDGEVPPHNPNKDFLNLLKSHNPHHTGWPVWLISTGFRDETAEPYVFENAWEAFILVNERESPFGGWNNRIDFMRMDPSGKFYLYRSFEDDTRIANYAPIPLKVLDSRLPILRTAETISVGISFAKALGCAVESTKLEFTFRWKRLEGRKLVSWIMPHSTYWGSDESHQDEVQSFVTVPLETSLVALPDYVHRAIQPLFNIFDGTEIERARVADLTNEIIEKKY